MTTLSAKEQHNYNVLQSLHEQGYEIHLGGPEIGGLTVEDSLNAFYRNHQFNYSDEFIEQVIENLGAQDSRMNLQSTQGALQSQERSPLGIYRTKMAKEDRAQFGDAMNEMNDPNDEPTGGPSPG